MVFTRKAKESTLLRVPLHSMSSLSLSFKIESPSLLFAEKSVPLEYYQASGKTKESSYDNSL